MATNVTFDVDARVIRITKAPDVDGFVRLDVRRDIYSAGKVDWLQDPELNKFIFPIDTLGGEDLGGGLFVGSYFFIRNDIGWRIQAFDADHELVLTGNIYPRNPDTPAFIPTTSNSTVVVAIERSANAQALGVQELNDSQVDLVERFNQLACEVENLRLTTGVLTTIVRPGSATL